MSLKTINKNKVYNGKRVMNKIIVAYLISILAIGTVLPTVHSDSAGFYSLDSQEQAPSGGNQPPVFGTPTPSNGSTNNSLSFTWSIPIGDPEGNIFSWTIQCSNGQTNNEFDAINWTKTLVVSGLASSTMYTVWVNATDPYGSGLCGSGLYTRKVYTFTTKQWRFHPLPSNITRGIIGGVIALKSIPHTTVRGLFFNVQQSMSMTSFYALRIHYWTTGPFRHVRGATNFKSCTGGMIIGPILLLKIGPLHNIVYGTFTFLGDIHYKRSVFGQGFTNTLLTA
jgi:hypothetical protein